MASHTCKKTIITIFASTSENFSRKQNNMYEKMPYNIESGKHMWVLARMIPSTLLKRSAAYILSAFVHRCIPALRTVMGT